MKLIGTKVLVKEANKTTNMTKAGLFIPEKESKKYKVGTVIEVGDGTKDEPVMKVSKDDEIYFSSFAGTEVLIGTEKYIIIDQKDILVIL